MPCTAPIRRSSTNGCSSRRAVTASGPSTRTWVLAPGAGSVASPSLERPEGSGASPHTCAPSRRAAGSSTSTTSPATPRSRAGRRRETTWPCARTRGASPPILPGPSGSIPGTTAGSSPRSVTSGPVFDDFVLRPDPSERIRLRWGQRGPDRTFLAREAGDGTLRLVRLAALLPGPDSPATVVLDEPELGLHPVATDLLAEMTRTAGRNGRKVILATQSAPSVPHFELDEIVVLSGVAGATQVSRPDGGFLASFLEDHSTGSLRGMNPLGGGPAHEGAVRWGRSSSSSRVGRRRRSSGTVLAPAALVQDVGLTSTIVTASATPAGDHRGGGGWKHHGGALHRLLAAGHSHRIGLLIDHDRYPGALPDETRGNSIERQRILVGASREHYRDPRFRPLVVLHEIEALVLAAIDSDPGGRAAPGTGPERAEGRDRARRRSRARRRRSGHGPVRASREGRSELQQDRHGTPSHRRGGPRRRPRTLPRLRRLVAGHHRALKPAGGPRALPLLRRGHYLCR